MNINEWIEGQHENNEGTIHVSCIIEHLPHHPEDVRRYQVHNEEDTIDKKFDLTFDDDGEIVNVEEY